MSIAVFIASTGKVKPGLTKRANYRVFREQEKAQKRSAFVGIWQYVSLIFKTDFGQ